MSDTGVSDTGVIGQAGESRCGESRCVGAIPWPLTAAATEALVARFLAEDVGPERATGDVTSHALLSPGDRLSAVMRAREPLIVAGLPFAAAVFWAMDRNAVVSFAATDGDRLDAGAALMTVSGMAAAVLTAERTALNMLQHLSGIATLTARYQAAIADTGARLLDTRKTTPGLRLLEKYAVRLGGGGNHRLGLYDAMLIKDNHLAVVGSVAEAVARARAGSGLPVQVECDTLVQVAQALAAGADSLLLDNMPVETLRRAVALVAGRIPTEASGGVRLETIRALAETGVTYISVGRLTQSAAAVDIGLDCCPIQA